MEREPLLHQRLDDYLHEPAADGGLQYVFGKKPDKQWLLPDPCEPVIVIAGTRGVWSRRGRASGGGHSLAAGSKAVKVKLDSAIGGFAGLSYSF